MTGQLDRLTKALAGRFTIEGEVGRGGTAIVYRATDTRLGRKVALKVLHPELSSAIAVERFRREIGIAAGLNHPYIVAVHESGDADGLLYYVMPYVDGHTLREELQRTGPLSLQRAIAIARDLAEGLDFAHSAGIIHRDLKPGNILLSGGHALITDFGVARAVETAAAADLTLSSVAIGTPAYMSPEQAAGQREIDARADVYALGCVFFEMLTGATPFRAKNARAMLSMHVAERAPSILNARKDVPAAVDDAVARALAKSPEERFPAAGDFVSRIDAASRSALEPFPARWHELRRWFTAQSVPSRIVAGTAVPAALGSLAVMAWPEQPQWHQGRPDSIVVLPFAIERPASGDDHLLAADIASAVGSELDA
jgi:serine/threonine-protein kinase